jgi:hypothetical protein
MAIIQVRNCEGLDQGITKWPEKHKNRTEVH